MDKRHVASGFALVVFGLLAVGSVPSNNQTTSDSSSSPSSSSGSSSSGSGAWYEGGTLHRATLGEWRAATYQNRLATASDFATKLGHFTDLDLIRVKAEEMETCISAAAEGGQLDSQQVSQVGAACAVQLGYQ